MAHPHPLELNGLIGLLASSVALPVAQFAGAGSVCWLSLPGPSAHCPLGSPRRNAAGYVQSEATAGVNEG